MQINIDLSNNKVADNNYNNCCMLMHVTVLFVSGKVVQS